MLEKAARSFLLPIAAFAVLLGASTARAEPPAAIRSPGEERAQRSFARFAEAWMEKIQRMEEEQRRSPTVRPGSAQPLVTYRGYNDDFNIELRPTGHPSAPYVGILRYTEYLYTCPDMQATDCTVASTVPVTEIFRFQGGRWVY